MLRSTRVPPGMFSPTCSAVPFRPERNTRPRPADARNPGSRPVLSEEGGSTASRWTPLPRHAQVDRTGSAQAEGGRASAGRGEAGERRARGVGGRSGSEGDGRAANGGGAVGNEGVGIGSSDGRRNPEARGAGRGRRVSASFDAIDARSSLRSPGTSRHQSDTGPRLRPAA